MFEKLVLTCGCAVYCIGKKQFIERQISRCFFILERIFAWNKLPVNDLRHKRISRMRKRVIAQGVNIPCLVFYFRKRLLRFSREKTGKERKNQ